MVKSDKPGTSGSPTRLRNQQESSGSHLRSYISGDMSMVAVDIGVFKVPINHRLCPQKQGLLGVSAALNPKATGSLAH